MEQNKIQIKVTVLTAKNIRYEVTYERNNNLKTFTVENWLYDYGFDVIRRERIEILSNQNENKGAK